MENERAEGRAEGLTEGLAKGQVLAARKFKASGILTDEQIAQTLGLTIEQVRAL